MDVKNTYGRKKTEKLKEFDDRSNKEPETIDDYIDMFTERILNCMNSNSFHSVSYFKKELVRRELAANVYFLTNWAIRKGKMQQKRK